MDKRKFKVSGMSCAACSARVERAVSSLSGVEKCEVSLLLGEMRVVGSISESTVISAVTNAGYGAEVEKGIDVSTYDAERENEREIKAVRNRLIFSGAVLLFLMYISMGYVMWDFPLPQFLSKRPFLIGMLELVLTSLIMVINKQFFVKGARGIVNLAPNMDTLVALGSGVSYVYSIVLLLTSGLRNASHHTLHMLYFESAAMILVLITVGKLFETLAKGKTTSAIRSLMDLTPKEVTVIRGGKEITVPAREIAIGDVFIVKKGENIACDGMVIDGEISVDESALTGESIPKDIHSGGSVFGATTVLSGWAKIEAVKVGEETAIAEIIRMVREASSSKAPVAKAADKIASIFVPSVLLISLVTFIIWMLVGADLSDAISRAVTVLVISCPCALGLATPVAIMVGSGVGAKAGILFKSAASLEAAGRIKVVAFDKTGTITEGKPEVTDVVACSVEKQELIRIAAAIEVKSEHPLASAITGYAKNVLSSPLPECKRFEAFVGGVSAEVGEEKYYIGNERFISEKASLSAPDDFERFKKQGKTTLIVSNTKSVIGIIAIADKIKEDSAKAIEELHSLGIKTVMITGDNSAAAESVARSVGIDEVRAEVLPQDKARVVKALSSHGSVAMVGDGINDSVALTEADVGIAIGRGADVAIDSADVVLTRSSLLGVASAVKLGRRVLLNVYENLFWAFSYNTIGIPLAAGAFIKALGWTLSPMFGAAAMSVSSFLVVVNALRLNLYNPNKITENENNSLQKSLYNANIQEKCVENGECNNSEKTENNEYANGKNEVSFEALNFKNSENSERENTNNGVFVDDKEREENMKNITVKIEGMMCPHCSGRVKNALEASELVMAADVSHERGDAIITLSDIADENSVSELKKIINDAGYVTP